MNQNQQVVPLARLDKIKDIGVYFDTRLDFKDHMHEKNNAVVIRRTVRRIILDFAIRRTKSI